MADHTPTPWEVFDNGRLLVIAPGAGWSVFEIEASHQPDRPTHEANAAFIVRAVNAHDDLVKALRTIVDGASADVSDTAIVIGSDAKAALAFARAALAKAAS